MNGYIRFGKLPPGGRSYNHLCQYFEEGVSAFRARKTSLGYCLMPMTGREVADLKGLCEHARNIPVLFLRGHIVGRGGSGEPLLSEINTVEVVPKDAKLYVIGLAKLFLQRQLDEFNQYKARRRETEVECVESEVGVDIPDPVELLARALEEGTNTTSRLHGPRHWRLVAYTAMTMICTRGLRADIPVVFLFALLHDSMRLSDGPDREHGTRAADFARKLCGELFTLTDERLDLLTFALEYHDKGETSTNVTIGCCWDADRLNLWRVGIRPQPSFLSVKDSVEFIDWAWLLQSKDYDWQTIFRFYGLPCESNPPPDPTSANRSGILSFVAWEIEARKREYLDKWGILEDYDRMKASARVLKQTSLPGEGGR